MNQNEKRLSRRTFLMTGAGVCAGVVALPALARLAYAQAATKSRRRDICARWRCLPPVTKPGSPMTPSDAGV